MTGHVRAFTAALIVALVFSSAVVAAESAPKGVVLVVIDDIGYGDIDGLYPSDLETPHIDAFHNESVRLTDFHVGTTCAPSRAAIMTGRSVNAGGVWHTIAGRELLREDEQTMADVFRANHWKTGIFGKWHLGDGFPYSPRFRGFDTAVVHGGGGVGQGPDYWGNDYYAKVNHKGEPTSADVYWENGETFEADEFCTDLWFSRAKRFMKDSVAAERPFFCYIPTNAAHSPFNAPHGFKKGFDGLIENVDYNMGQLDQFLTDEGLKDDVLVIFTTDNGTTGKREGGLRGRKGSHFDGGHNVPCFWRWKNGGLGGSTQSARDVTPLTSAMDLLPTFIDMFGLKKPAGGQPLDGISLKPLLLNLDSAPVERTIVVDTQRGASLKKWFRACVMRDEVVDGKIAHKWRLTRNSDSAPLELYDFQVDRDTDKNLADQHPDLLEQLAADYETWWTHISEDQEPFPPFVVNSMHEPELTLFAHSWIGEDMTPWNQPHVVQAKAGTRVHAVRFDEGGQYRIELRRWPREDGGAIAGPDKAGNGKVLNITQARLEIAGAETMSKPVKGDATSVAFEVELPAETTTTVATAFLDDSDEILSGAYYVYIKKLP